ncbi:MAG: M67 family metallopeptidase [candidate division NC10 bacterium]|nr:M67 family metallopeptidase [candidate division NC10 bacterium]
MFSLPLRIYRAMIGHARTAFPHEACGILAGREGQVERFYPTGNREASPVRFRVDPSEQLQVLRAIEELGWSMVGIFHSHVGGPAFPSPEDIQLAYDPDVLYVILSLQDQDHPQLRGFWIREGKVQEEPIHLLAEAEEGERGGEGMGRGVGT